MTRKKKERARRRQQSTEESAGTLEVVRDFHGNGNCLMYAHWPNRPQFVAQNVPPHDSLVIRIKGAIVGAIEFIANTVATDYKNKDAPHTIHVEGADFNIYVRAHSIEGRAKDRLLMLLDAPAKNFQVPLYEIAPFFPLQERGCLWGQLPPAPEGQDHMASDIVVVWSKHSGIFRWFLDGNRFNRGRANLKLIRLKDALRRTELQVNWDVGLTPDQILYVRKHNKYFRYLAKHLHAKTDKCENCYQLWRHSSVVGRCSRCKMTWYCNVECQAADWTRHKAICKQCQSYGNKGKTANRNRRNRSIDNA